MGDDIIYRYNIESNKASPIFSECIERFTISLSGEYIAYATRTGDGKPTANLFIANIETGEKSLVVNNAYLASRIYWLSGDSGLLFSETESSITNGPVYSTRKFVFTNAQSSRGDGQ